MIKRFCDVCGKELSRKEFAIICKTDTVCNTLKIYDNLTDTYNPKSETWDICHDCEQAVRACIGNRKAKAERGKE